MSLTICLPSNNRSWRDEVASPRPKHNSRVNKTLRVVGIVLNLVEGRPTKLATELEDVLRKTYGDLVFTSVIHKGVRLEESPAFQQSVMEYEPHGRPAVEFRKLIDELLQRLESDHHDGKRPGKIRPQGTTDSAS